MPRSDQGVQKKRYQVIPRTLIFLFDEHDRVLLLKGSKNKSLWPGLLNGIGGHVEQGEDIMESALRELVEEAGIEAVPLHYCGQIMIDVHEDLGVALFLFRGFYNGDNLFPSREGELCWISINSLKDEQVVEDLQVLLPLIHDHKFEDPYIIGKYLYDSEGKLRILIR